MAGLTLPPVGVPLFSVALLLVSLFVSACSESKSMPPVIYPETRRGEVVEQHFGQQIADPYRWLENDVRIDKEVSSWVTAQNRVTRAYLDALPGRAVFEDRLKQLYDYDRFTLPVAKGGRYFYMRYAAGENQGVLHVRGGVDGEPWVLIDPNAWAADGATALAEWTPTRDGSRVAYAMQDGGTDWRTIRVLDVGTGRPLDDEVRWARFTSIAWARDGSGFFYNRFPESRQDAAHQAGVANQAIYFHALGTEQTEDRLVYSTPAEPGMIHPFTMTEDGRYLVVTSTAGTMTTNLVVLDLDSRDWSARTVAADFEDQWHLAGNVGSTFFLMTTRGASRFKLARMDIASAAPTLIDVVPEQEAVLSDASLIGGRLLLSYLVDVKTEVRRYTLDGKPDGVVGLPGIGTVLGFKPGPHAGETFFGYTSFNVPGTIYRYDVDTNIARIWNEAKVSVDLDRIVVEQRFYRSKDGTRVPMFIIRRSDVTGPAPTVLYAYGGFGLSEMPAFSATRLAWIEQGGVFAVANIRGGAEYGRAWHEAGRGSRKQNVFDDFIAAAEYLKAEGITSQNGLAIHGASNGGLLVGAVVNQRPDLFDVALPEVGVMDMLRFDKFTGGQLWVPEFGSPSNEAEFSNLLSYSPLHTIRPGQDYPASLSPTADTDDRVVPGHSFKYVAALQAADIGTKPHLILIETRAGHGAGKPTDKIIAQTADMWAFAAHWTGLAVSARP